MVLHPQQRTRRLFWFALFSLLLAATAFMAVVALREQLPTDDWLLGFLLILTLLFLLSFVLIIWILLFRRAETRFPRWSVAVGLLGAGLFFALISLPFMTYKVARQGNYEEAPAGGSPPETYPLPSPSPPSPPPPPPPSGNLTVDDLIARMSLAPVAFDVPRAMQLEDITEVQLILGPSHDLRELIATLNKESAQGAVIRITDRMEAHLSGAGFQITTVTPELQAVSRSDVTSWRWEVKAMEPGHHRLHLTLTAVLDLGGSLTPRAIKTFDRTVEVEVTFGRKIANFGQANWQWMWAVLVAPLGGWFMRKRLRSHRTNRD